MKIICKRLELETADGLSVHDITGRVGEILSSSCVQNGQLTVFTRHTTTGIAINENEGRLLNDMAAQLESIAPMGKAYSHDDIHLRGCPPNERKNGHAHVKALVLSASQTIPIIEGALCLGKWQAVLFFELDGGRKREVIVHVMGD